VQNLNRTEPLVFGAPPRKKRGAKFRMQPFKGGNVTVALVNYDAAEAAPNGNYGRKWFCTVFVGAGKQYETYPIRGRTLQAIQSNILTKIDDGPEFIAAFKQHFDGRIGNHAQLQALWESNRPHDGRLLGPLHLVEEIARFIRDYDRAGVILENFSADGIKRDRLPKRQLLAMWALGQVASGQGA
jgi:hypothetical protein